MPTYTGSCTVRTNVNSGGSPSWTTGIPSTASAVALGQQTDTLWCQLAASLVIPSTEIVVGVQFDISKGSIIPIGGADSLIQMIVGGSQIGDNRSAGATWGTVHTASSYGGATDMWGNTLATTSFDTGFGVAIRGISVSGAATDYSVDTVSATVYTLIPGDTDPIIYLAQGVHPI